MKEKKVGDPERLHARRLQTYEEMTPAARVAADRFAARDHKEVGAEASDHVRAFEKRLAARESDEKVSRDWIEGWNRNARDIVKRLIAAPTPSPAKTVVPPTPAPAPPRVADRVLLKAKLDPRDGEAVSSFLANVRKVLNGVGSDEIRVALIRDEEDA